MDTTVPPSEAVAAGTEDKTVAILSYITLIGFIAAIIMHQNNRTRLGAFHLRQVLGLALTSAAGAVFWVVPILGWIAWFLLLIPLFVLWILGLLSAIRGEMRPVPILGAQYQRWFANAFASVDETAVPRLEAQ
ncbi:MAG TPA: hypothetical protein VFG66_02685 [Gemmatimonadales bacterium]|nr:hypothetical protein [Gemmatimonadales bacterium]